MSVYYHNKRLGKIVFVMRIIDVRMVNEIVIFCWLQKKIKIW